MILTCTCRHFGQDVLHGVEKRVHNLTSKDNARCTVCGKENPVGKRQQDDDGKDGKKK